MADSAPSHHFVFPRWATLLLPLIVIVAVGVPVYLGLLIPFGLSPTTLNVGYQPRQPVPYSHELHVNQLGMDCRYCHTTVDRSAFAAIPPTQTCMNCHHAIRKNSAKLKPVRDSYRTGKPIAWVKVNDLPDYVYFNHSVHVNAGVSCVECHGRVDRMDETGVRTVQNMSMSWCLSCHRNPGPHLRPRKEVFNLAWAPLNGQTQAQFSHDQKLMKKYDIPSTRSLTDCSTCHR